jgi:hypothetical protein
MVVDVVVDDESPGKIRVAPPSLASTWVFQLFRVDATAIIFGALWYLMIKWERNRYALLYHIVS